jgi:hypothetical protein
LITFGQQHRRVALARRAAPRWGVLLVAGLALGAVGCSQTTSPSATEAAITGPLVLNSAPGATLPAEATAPMAVAPTTQLTAAAPTPVVTTATAPVAASQPATQPTALQPVPAPAASTAAANDGQFPNINKPPTQPGGTLLPEAARAQIIADLEALRAGQAAPSGGGGGGNPADLATQAQTHGDAAIRQIEACSEDGALQNNPDCAPAD